MPASSEIVAPKAAVGWGGPSQLAEIRVAIVPETVNVSVHVTPVGVEVDVINWWLPSTVTSKFN